MATTMCESSSNQFISAQKNVEIIQVSSFNLIIVVLQFKSKNITIAITINHCA